MTAQQIIARPFNLQRYFAFFSLLSIILISAISAYVLFRYLSQHLLERDAQVSMEFIQSVARINNPEPYFRGSTQAGDRGQLQEFFEHITTIPDVLRANVYDNRQFIIWSDEAELISRRFDDNDELSKALTGVLVFKQERVSSHSKKEHTFLPAQVTDFIESYVPIWNNEQDEVIGVVELYKSPSALYKALSHGRWLVVFITLTGGILLYLVLFWLVRRASNVINQQQQALVESERLSAIGDLASAISHNLRNGMATIRSSGELLQDHAEHLVSKSANDIVNKVDQLNQWLRVLLVYAHTADQRPQAVAIAPLIGACLNQFTDRIRALQIKTEIDLPADLPPVSANPEFLTQVFNSLIANALDAMPGGGLLRISGQRQAQTLMICLHDTGQGIAKQQLQDIFRPLVSHKVGGLGVGLPLARRLLQRYGGELQLSSELGRGTIAQVQLLTGSG